MSLVLVAVITLAVLCLVFGAILGFAAVRFRVEGNPIVDQINALLPQTQCGQCGYDGCRRKYFYMFQIHNNNLVLVSDLYAECDCSRLWISSEVNTAEGG